jgi:hypothetical protein
MQKSSLLTHRTGLGVASGALGGITTEQLFPPMQCLTASQYYRVNAVGSDPTTEAGMATCLTTRPLRFKAKQQLTCRVTAPDPSCKGRVGRWTDLRTTVWTLYRDGPRDVRSCRVRWPSENAVMIILQRCRSGWGFLHVDETVWVDRWDYRQ